MSDIVSCSITSCNYKSEKQKRICSEFGLDHKEFLLVSHKTGCYKGLLSEKASFRPKNLTY